MTRTNGFLGPVLFVGSLCVTPFLPAFAHAQSIHQSSTAEFQQVETSDNLSQLVRSNAIAYWTWLRAQESSFPGLPPYLAAQGIVAGDPHLGQWTFIPVRLERGHWALRFLNIDFDDVGVGSFAGDFIKFVTTIKAESDDVRIPDLVAAYQAGLRGSPRALPNGVTASLSTGVSPASYDLVTLDGGKKFWIREKKIEIYSRPDPDHRGSRDAYRELATYDAYLLGKAHGAQPSSLPLRRLIDADPDRFRETIKPAVHEFLDRARRAL